MLKRQRIEIYVSGFFLCACSSPVADPVVFGANVDFFSPKDIQYFQYNKGSIRKFFIFTICFHLNREENDDYVSSSEEHIKNRKTSRGLNFDPGLSNFVKIFEFYLMTQSL
jgi:hypothetical protein